MESVQLNRRGVLTVKSSCRGHTVGEVKSNISCELGVRESEFYLVQNGKKLGDGEHFKNSGASSFENIPVTTVAFRLLGGKGGFGSMLRAIGAQIEKTTNRDACRDLSGRRLRDINEEQRLKRWFAKQNERELEKEEAKKKKIEKLKKITEGPPLPVINDEQYNKQRADMVDSVYDAVDKGFEVHVPAKASSSSASATVTSSASVASDESSKDSSSGSGVADSGVTPDEPSSSSSAGPSKPANSVPNKRKAFKKLMMDEDFDSCSSSDSEVEESTPKKARLA